jgi:hypothetical protein
MIGHMWKECVLCHCESTEGKRGFASFGIKKAPEVSGAERDFLKGTGAPEARGRVTVVM